MKNYKQVNEFQCIIDELKKGKEGIDESLKNIEMPELDEDEFKYPVGRKNECETCGGHGFVLKRYQHPQLINPAETKCNACGGTGRKEEE